MSDIDFSKIKVGDYVTVRVLVADDPAVNTRRVLTLGGNSFWVSASDIVSHEPAPWTPEVGDVVEWVQGRGEWVVRAVNGNMGWVHSTEGDVHYIVPLSSITLIRKGSAA